MYYPKSQIKTNLFTNGKEYILSTTKKEYKGYYYEISNGNKYTGKSPQEGNNILLLSPDTIFFDINTSILTPEADSLTSPVNNLIIPQDTIPNQSLPPIRSLPKFNPTTPTTQDQQNGQFNRYFCKKNNEIRYLEIDKNTFLQLQKKNPRIAWDLYTPVSLTWQITGNKEQVYRSNKASAIAIEQNLKWYGFSQYFQDKFLKYYTPLTLNNLYTAGGEFTTQNGQNYIGYYHIHEGKTPMIGKIHTNTPHETLIPTNSQVINKNQSNLQNIPTTSSQNNTLKNPNISYPQSQNMGNAGNISGGGGSYGGGGGY